jgi:hypothetical protein
MTDWYYQAMGSVLGPVSFEVLRRMADRGEIKEHTLAREGSDGPWQAASEVNGLFVEPSGGSGLLSEGGDDEAGAVRSESERTDSVDEHEHHVRRSPLTLRPCSDCGKMVSRHARACPDCGRPFRENSFEIPYMGEQPIPVWVLFSVVAAAFILISPVVVHRLVQTVAARTPEADEMAGQLAVIVAAGYVLSMLVCAALGAAVGAPRMAYFTGLLLGLFFGPLGVFAAFAIDKRPLCPSCFERLNGIAKECPACHSGLTWVLARRWY